MGAQALVSWHAALRRSTESGPGAVLQRGPDGSRDAKTWTKAVPSVCGAAVAEPGRFEGAVPLRRRLFALWALDRGLKSSKFFESCGFVWAVCSALETQGAYSSKHSLGYVCFLSLWE